VVTPDVPRELEDIISRCLRKAPPEPWQSMREIEVALNHLRRKRDSSIPQTPHIAPAGVAQPNGNAPRNPRKRLIYAGACVALLAAAMVSGRWWTSSRQATGKPSAPVATPTYTSAAPTPAPPGAASASADSVLTHADIVRMIQAEVPISVILGQIRSSRTNFNLTGGEMIVLAAAGVPAAAIEAMRNPKLAPAPDAAAAQPRATPSPSSLAPFPAAANSSATVESAPALPATAPENKPAIQLVCR
jgi:hypothetical protein